MLFKKKEQIETQRESLERDWIDYYKIWAQEKNGAETMPYDGMNEIYLPDTYILTETEVDHLKQSIFPFSNNIAVRPWASNPVAPFLVFPLLELLQYDINQANIKSNIDVVLRNSIIYGWSAVKVVWQVETLTDYARQVVQDPLSTESQVGYAAREVIKFEGPTFHPVDPFALYFHPYRETDPSRSTWAHENMTVGWDFLLSMQAEGVYMGIERLLEKKSRSNTQRTDQNIERRTERNGVTEDQVSDEQDTFKLTEIWTKFDLYGDGRLIPTKITYSGDDVLEVRQNPHNDQDHPYLMHRDAKVVESIYGRSRIKSVKGLQYTNNAVINQGLDSNAFASNNMIVVDTSRLKGRVEDIEISPLMVFQMTGDASDKAIRFVAPPNTIQQNVLLSENISTRMRDAFRIPAGIQGKTENTTATEVATTTQAGLVGISGVATNFETDLMSKWLSKAYKREQQFRGIDSPPRAGMPTIPAEALVPDYMFQFLSGDAAAQYLRSVQEAMLQAQAGTEGAPFGGDHENGTPQNNAPTPDDGGAESV